MNQVNRMTRKRYSYKDFRCQFQLQDSLYGKSQSLSSKIRQVTAKNCVNEAP